MNLTNWPIKSHFTLRYGHFSSLRKESFIKCTMKSLQVVCVEKEGKFTWFRASCNWVILSAIFVSRLVTKQPWSHSGPPLCGVYNQTRAVFLSLLVCPKKTNLWKYLIEIFQRAHRFVSIWLKKWVLKFLQCCQKIIYHKLVVKCQGEPLQT